MGETRWKARGGIYIKNSKRIINNIFFNFVGLELSFKIMMSNVLLEKGILTK